MVEPNDMEECRMKLLPCFAVLMMKQSGVHIPQFGDLADCKALRESEPEEFDSATRLWPIGACRLVVKLGGLSHDRFRPGAIEYFR